MHLQEGKKQDPVSRGHQEPLIVRKISLGGVYESTPNVPGSSRNVEEMLENIITRLERIEEKIDENVYPPESMIKPEFIQQVKKARADIKLGKGKMYNSIDDFFMEIET